MKKLKMTLCMLLTAALLFGEVALGEADDSDFTFEINEAGGVTITGYTGSDADLVVPDTLDGRPVTAIAERAFEGESESGGLSRVHLPEGLESIGAFAFADQKIERINIPDSVTTIAPGAFADCAIETLQINKSQPCYALTANGLYEKSTRTLVAALKGLDSIPDGILVIGAYAFQDCHVGNGLRLPDSITEISEYAFCGAKFDGAFSLPENIARIPDYAFYGAEFVGALSLPEHLEHIGMYAFANAKCVSSAEISDLTLSYGFSSAKAVHTSSSAAGEIMAGADAKATALLSGGTTGGSAGKIRYDANTFFALPSVTLDQNAFENFVLRDRDTYQGEAVFDIKNVLNLPDFCFSGSEIPNDGTIDLPSVECVGAGAFREVSGDVALPDSVREVGESAFAGFGSAALGKAERIGDHSFDGRTVTELPDTLISIGEQAFRSSAIPELTVPATVTEIGGKAFAADIILYVEEGSYAESWAGENGYWYEPVGSDSVISADDDWLTGNDVKYADALALMEAGEYGEAEEAFEALGDYGDCPAKVSECRYAAALELKEEGRYAEAQAAFEALADYGDSAAMAQECAELAASAEQEEALEAGRLLEEDGDLFHAYMTYEAMEDSETAQDALEACRERIYQEADRLKTEDLLAEAEFHYEFLGGLPGLPGAGACVEGGTGHPEALSHCAVRRGQRRPGKRQQGRRRSGAAGNADPARLSGGRGGRGLRKRHRKGSGRVPNIHRLA